MEHNLSKITNQARFITMIVEGKLKIAKRKKLDVVRDLRDEGFDTFNASKDESNTLRNRARKTDAFEEGEDGKNEDEKREDAAMDIDEEDEDQNESDLKRLAEGYKYLLSMALSSLTKERVKALLDKKGEMIENVEKLKKKTHKNL